ncbi:MAG: AI-2E family transporter [Roseburia sp.]|nr:AI-2E family transporter [Roseburia sp.]MCM1279453.1 AI-2E family transporter [Robinsoniella sp.]
MEQQLSKKKFIVSSIFIMCLVLVIKYFDRLILVVGKLWGVAYPLILGAAIAYILNIVLKKVEKLYFPNSQKAWAKKSRRIVSIFLSIFLIFAIIMLIVTLIVPELVNAFLVIGREIPIAFEQVKLFLADHSKEIPTIEKWINGINIDWPGMTKKILDYAGSGVGGILNSTFSFVGVLTNGIINFVIALIFAIYILAAKETLASQSDRMIQVCLKEKNTARLKKVIKTADDTFSSFIIGQCTEAVVLGVLCTLGMLLCRFPYAPMIGAFVGATALIPVVGAYLGAFVGAFMILTVNPTKALLFVLFIIVLQQLEGNLIYPKVVGSSIGLPGIWVLAAVTVGGGIGGVFGMLCGVPAAATVYKLIGESVREKEEKKKSAIGKRETKSGRNQRSER